MDILKNLQKQTLNQMEEVFQSVRQILDTSFHNIEIASGLVEPEVQFPEDAPFTVVTPRGSVRLEPLAYATLRYCYYIYETQNRNEIAFEEVGEKIYGDQFKARSTIQNTVKRGEEVNLIGITYFYFGEYIFFKINEELPEDKI